LPLSGDKRIQAERIATEEGHVRSCDLQKDEDERRARTTAILLDLEKQAKSKKGKKGKNAKKKKTRRTTTSSIASSSGTSSLASSFVASSSAAQPAWMTDLAKEAYDRASAGQSLKKVHVQALVHHIQATAASSSQQPFCTTPSQRQSRQDAGSSL